jgi:hypothetical protein
MPDKAGPAASDAGAAAAMRLAIHRLHQDAKDKLDKLGDAPRRYTTETLRIYRRGFQRGKVDVLYVLLKYLDEHF